MPAAAPTSAPDTSPSTPPAALEALLDRALFKHGEGALEEAAWLYETCLALDPGNAVVLHNLGVLRAGQGRTPEAIELIGRAIQVDPDSAAAHVNLGGLLLGRGRPADAEAAFERALALQADHPGALAGLGEVLAAGGRLADAEGRYLQAIDIDPTFTPALTGLGIVLMQAGRPRQAGERFCQALALQPGSARAHYNVANALKALGRLDEAASYFHDALKLQPGYADAWTNLGNLMQTLGDGEQALFCHQRAVALSPGDPRSRLNLGQVLKDRGDADAARAELDAALALDPSNAAAALSRCMAELPLAYADDAEVESARAGYAARLDQLISSYDHAPRPEAYARAIGASQPFYLAYQGQDDRELQARYGAFACRVMDELRLPAASLPVPAPGERVRVGVVSGFFKAHSNWKIPIRGWIEHIDRSRFEVIGYHTGAAQDACTRAAQTLCDRFVQGPLSADAWRELILADAPHVLIYPEIGMDPMAVQLAAQRLARLQCASWGHPETTGLPTMDAFLSSELMEPPGAEASYTERLVRLPGLGVVVDPVEEAPEPLDRAALGLRPTATVFWCAQSLPKYLPRFDDIYPRIAAGVGDCQFVFIGLPQRSQAEARFLGRLQAAFERHGLRFAEHCVVLPRLGKAQFLGALAQADALLDSLEWSGCNSTLESLSADLPMVTFEGALMRGRHSAAILRIMGLEEAIVHSVDDYVRAAVRLGSDRGHREALRAAIRTRKHRLYGDDRCVRALEDFLQMTLERPAGSA